MAPKRRARPGPGARASFPAVATKRAKTPPLDVVPPAEVEALAARVRTERAVLRKKALPFTLSPRGEAWLRDALARDNLDAGKRFFRVRLSDQVTHVLEQQAALPIAALKKAVAGIEAASELTELVGELVRAKSARVVLENGKPSLVRFSTPVVPTQALSEALGVSEALVKLLRAGKTGSKKSPAQAVLLNDVRRLLHAVEGAIGANVVSKDLQVLSRLAELTSAQEPIVFVPTLVDALAADLGAAAVSNLLVEAHQAGKLELRPDSGVRPLTPAQAALCPKGPTGAPLSYVRLISPSRP